MKIWIVHQYAIPPSRTGFTRSYDIARRLINLGHEVTLIASSFDHFAKREMPRTGGAYGEPEVIHGVPFLWIHTPPYSGNSLSRLWGMLVFGVKVWLGRGFGKLSKPDVIVGSSPSPFAALGAERRAAHLGVPFVLEVRDLWPQTPIELGNYSRVNPMILLMGWIERHLYSASRLIISVLPNATDHMVSKGAKADKIVWIPNGVDFTTVPVPLTATPRAVCRAIYAGSHGVANGLDTVVEAAKILQEMPTSVHVEIVLYGDGPEKGRLEEKARAYQLTNIKFCEPVPKAQIWPVLFDADVCLMVLKNSPVFRWGVSPNKLFDYMAAARPVIFSVGSSYDPVALSQSGISVQPGDPVELANAILEVLTRSHEDRQQMGQQGRLYVEENHDLRKLTSKFVGVLSMVVHNSVRS